MRICMILIGRLKYDTRVLREISTLVEAGHELSIISWDNLEKDEEFDKSADYDIIKFNVTLPGFIFKIPDIFSLPLLCVIYLLFLAYVTNFTLRNRFDIYHCHDMSTLPAGYIASIFSKAKLVYDSHELYTEQYFSGTLRFVRRFLWGTLERTLIHKCEKVITVNEIIGELLVKKYGLEEVTILRNVSKLANSEEEPAEVMDLSEKIEDKIVFLHMGGLTPNRGLEQFIEALGLSKHKDRVIFLLIGEGPLRKKVDSIIKEKGLEKNVLIHDYVEPDELTSYTKKIDVGLVLTQNICPNHYYSSPNKLFQYMVSGNAILGSDFPYIGKIIREEKIGLSVDPSNPKRIAEKIDYFVEHPQELEEMKKRSRKVAVERYNWGIEEKKLIELYDSLK